MGPSDREESAPSADGSELGEFWIVARPELEPMERRWYLPAILVTLVFATPWYLPAHLSGQLWHGLPVWVWFALSGALALAGLTAFGALFLWRDRPNQVSAEQVRRDP